jgi:hypothetical protein
LLEIAAVIADITAVIVGYRRCYCYISLLLLLDIAAVIAG